MAYCLSSLSFNSPLPFSSSPKIELGTAVSRRLCISVRSQPSSDSGSSRRSYRQVWRRRKLTKKDKYLESRLKRIPFLEEHVWELRENGGLLAGDIDRLMKSEENRFQFVNEVAAEATEYVENNRDEYGRKKAILHVLSNRMNDAGFARIEAYMETDPFLPGPTSVSEELPGQ